MRGLHQMASQAKEIVDGAVDGEKALDVSRRFEAAHVAFALAGGLMRHLSAVVRILRGAVMDRGEGGPVGCPITAQLVGDQAVGNVAQPLPQLAKEPFGRTCIPAFLHQNIKRVSVLVDGPPQVIALSSDTNKQFIQMSGVARLSPSSA